MKHSAEIAKLSLNCSCKSIEYRNLDLGIISCIYMRPHNGYSVVLCWDWAEYYGGYVSHILFKIHCQIMQTWRFLYFYRDMAWNWLSSWNSSMLIFPFPPKKTPKLKPPKKPQQTRHSYLDIQGKKLEQGRCTLGGRGSGQITLKQTGHT